MTATATTEAGVGVEVRGLSVRYGGVAALDDVSLDAPLGRCTGLIGPNGAGKTTFFNACFGMLTETTGHVSLFGASLDRLSPAARARRGMARTFQRMELFDTMTVEENVQMGAEAAWVGGNVLRCLHRRRAGGRIVVEAREEAIELCGLQSIRHIHSRSLSTGQRRLVEFARALANPAQMLFLDEPSSGLDRAETAHFGQVLSNAISSRRIGVLLVEHDMTLVSAVCDRVHVLDFGRKIFEGSMAAAQRDSTVRAAYLGDPDGELVAFEGDAQAEVEVAAEASDV